MAPAAARMALRQVSLTEVLGLLAYVEGFGLVIGSLGVVVEPTRLVREACADVVDGAAPWEPTRGTWPAHLRGVLRTRLAERLRREALSRGQDGRPVHELRMAVAQLGDLAGVADLAHSAGELMVFVRTGDAATLRAAIAVCDRVRTQLEAIAATGGREDTAPIVVMPPRLPPPPPAGVVVEAIKDGGPHATQPRGLDVPTPRERRVPLPPGTTPGSDR